MSFDSRLAPNPPRVPSAAFALPPTNALDSVHPGAAKVLRALHAIATEARGAGRAVVEGRQGGADYVEVERTAIAKNDPGILAAHIAGDALRVATATTLAKTAVARQDDLRRKSKKVLDEAGDVLATTLADLEDQYVVLAVTAWERRGTGAGLAAIEDADALVAQGRTLAALRMWCIGAAVEYDVAGRSPGWSIEAQAALYAAKVARDVANGSMPLAHPDWFAKHAPGDFAKWSREAGRRHESVVGAPK